ncbi:scm-like with four MBT domains protein 1 [Microplitis mediator]|uniref:scm-like with four MBT domains protein 1 n=1 Tax=Microplitis mediator TaxID=375433 RepID=UPI0025532136|nr:scm-like with four MBT domains protein 1 [Microplitis mediator]
MEPGTNQMQDKMLDEDNGFVWQDYLDATESIEVPQIMFPHVELTLQSEIEIGMALEVPTSKGTNEETSYWVATIVVACESLLRLRYFGSDDKSLEFWFNLKKETGHELGWCLGNNKKLEPPDVILKKSPDCLEKLGDFLGAAKSIPVQVLSGEELSMTDRIKQGMKVEVSDFFNPYKIWIATIIKNVGGRLLLRYDVPNTSKAPVKDFWIFCTSESLHPYGFTVKSDSKWFLEPPSSIVDIHTYEEWKEMIECGQEYQETLNLFNHSLTHPHHKFTVGMKLEAVWPVVRTKIFPATVVKVIDDIYFLVELDTFSPNKRNSSNNSSYSFDEKTTWLCTADHPYIFPVGWAKEHDVKLTAPKGWSLHSPGEFDWDIYLKESNTTAAPSELFCSRESAIDAGFEVGMHLEAVDPQSENTICAGYISKITADLLWIALNNYKTRAEHVVHMHSSKIFPVGWCESNHYPLKPPRDYEEVCKKLEKPEKEEFKKSIIDIPIPESRSSLWCPKIYFNYRCFTGPMISKGKLANLPKSVGPGPVTLVMKEVLSMVVSVGYRSARILRVLQCDTKPEPGYHLEILKAKHKNNTYRASVAVVTSGEMVPEFCKTICQKLSVCPNLFGPNQIPEDDCPDKCNRSTKTKYLLGKRGKPKGFPSILEAKTKPWGKKRRKKRVEGKQKNSPEPDQDDEMPYISIDIPKEELEEIEDFDSKPPLSEIDVMIEKDLQKSDKSDDIKTEVPSSNASDDSRSSFNDRKSKNSADSPNSDTSKSKNNNIAAVVNNSNKYNKKNKKTKTKKRDRDWDDSIESDNSDVYVEADQCKPEAKRPKTRKLNTNPLFWSVDDVFRYLRKTNDCKDVAYRVKQEEIDGLAFLLLNLPSLTEHMKLRENIAMKLCRHIEQVKVTFFLKHINEEKQEKN